MTLANAREDLKLDTLKAKASHLATYKASRGTKHAVSSANFFQFLFLSC